MQNPMSACPHCGAQISANARFCKYAANQSRRNWSQRWAARQVARELAYRCILYVSAANAPPKRQWAGMETSPTMPG